MSETGLPSWKATVAAAIEVATSDLKPAVSINELRPLDEAVGLQHVGKQPGFGSRESAASSGGAP